MLCVNCGQDIEEGKPFCKNCGAPAPAGQPPVGAESAAVMPADLQATTVRAAPGGETPPPPVLTSSVAPLAPPQGAPAGYGPGYGAGYGGGWQPAQGPPLGSPLGPPPGPPPGGGRTGLIVGIVAAAVIILAGAGVGVWLGLRDDGGATGTTKPATSTTKEATTTGSGTVGTGGSVTTGAGTTTTADGASTTQTIPSLTTAPPGVTTTSVDLATEWYIAYENLVMEMDYEHGRIPELADQINATLPNVPNWVYGELEDMADILGQASQTMAVTPVPPGFDDAHYWITQAAEHMAARIQATMDGIAVMWYSGSAAAGTDYFNTGRAERDAYEDALTEHYLHMPAD